MKTLFLTLLSVLLLSCSTDSQENYNRLTVEPVHDLNGVYYGQQGARVVNLQWYTNYDFPTFQPYYNTIRMNGNIVADYYYNINNKITIPVSGNFKSATFSVTQTVNGITSVEAVTEVKK